MVKTYSVYWSVAPFTKDYTSCYSYAHARLTASELVASGKRHVELVIKEDGKISKIYDEKDLKKFYSKEEFQKGIKNMTRCSYCGKGSAKRRFSGGDEALMCNACWKEASAEASVLNPRWNK